MLASLLVLVPMEKNGKIMMCETELVQKTTVRIR